jgi:hypothetical protein
MFAALRMSPEIWPAQRGSRQTSDHQRRFTDRINGTRIAPETAPIEPVNLNAIAVVTEKEKFRSYCLMRDVCRIRLSVDPVRFRNTQPQQKKAPQFPAMPFKNV